MKKVKLNGIRLNVSLLHFISIEQSIRWEMLQLIFDYKFNINMQYE